VSVVPPNNDFLGQFYGSLTVAEMASIEDAFLTVLTGQSIPASRYAPFRFDEGTVLEVNPSPTIGDKCLVVSNTSQFESFRQANGFNHCTVVPLVPIRYFNPQYSDGVAPVHVTQEHQTVEALAVCMEIYTIDFDTRMAEPVGSVQNPQEMAAVRNALRDYLHILPHI
jgi:hypothetical protein